MNKINIPCCFAFTNTLWLLGIYTLPPFFSSIGHFSVILSFLICFHCAGLNTTYSDAVANYSITVYRVILDTVSINTREDILVPTGNNITLLLHR